MRHSPNASTANASSTSATRSRSRPRSRSSDSGPVRIAALAFELAQQAGPFDLAGLEEAARPEHLAALRACVPDRRFRQLVQRLAAGLAADLVLAGRLQAVHPAERLAHRAAD